MARSRNPSAWCIPSIRTRRLTVSPVDESDTTSPPPTSRPAPVSAPSPSCRSPTSTRGLSNTRLASA